MFNGKYVKTSIVAIWGGCKRGKQQNHNARSTGKNKSKKWKSGKGG